MHSSLRRAADSARTISARAGGAVTLQIRSQSEPRAHARRPRRSRKRATQQKSPVTFGGHRACESLAHQNPMAHLRGPPCGQRTGGCSRWRTNRPTVGASSSRESGCPASPSASSHRNARLEHLSQRPHWPLKQYIYNTICKSQETSLGKCKAGT